MNPYQGLVSRFERLIREGKSLPLGGFPSTPGPAPDPGRPPVMIFAPHPDDECIVGGLPLRLLREARRPVLSVAVTQGSRPERQAPRLAELRGACEHLGFTLVPTRPGGLERINPDTRRKDPAHWRSCVETIAGLLRARRPGFVFLPHAADWNSTHIGTHFLVMDALATLPADFDCVLLETEYWAAHPAPNLMVESGTNDVADLVAATSFHVEEVKRNPYHLLLPAWMQDNVRRGGELVGGQGGAVPDCIFSTLYHRRRWSRGALQPAPSGGRMILLQDDPVAVLSD